MNCTRRDVASTFPIDCERIRDMVCKVSIKREPNVRQHRNSKRINLEDCCWGRRGGAEKIEINSQLRIASRRESFGNTDFPISLQTIDENTEIIHTIVSRSIVRFNYFQRGFINE